jgi:hypothetical protein
LHSFLACRFLLARLRLALCLTLRSELTRGFKAAGLLPCRLLSGSFLLGLGLALGFLLRGLGTLRFSTLGFRALCLGTGRFGTRHLLAGGFDTTGFLRCLCRLFLLRG